MNTQHIERRYDLDWLRVLTILAIFVFHCTRPFDSDDWLIKNATTYFGFDIWKEFAMTWGMPLILIISGSSAYFSLGKIGAGKYVQGIFARLLLPLIIGMFSHVAFQVYLENLNKGNFSGTFGQFYPHYFDGMYGFGGNFAWMGQHLWYLEILFILSLLFLPMFLWMKKTRTGKRVLFHLGNFLALPGAVFLFAVPAIPLMYTLDPETWGNQSLGGWSVLIYPFIFFSGFVLISNANLQARVLKMRWVSLGIALVLTSIYLFMEFQTHYPSLLALAHTVSDALYCLVSWTWLFTVLGFGMKLLNKNNPFLKYANEAALPFYILQQTVIVAVAYSVVRLPIADWLKLLLIMLISFGLVMMLYEYVVRRTNLLRLLFGMKLLPRTSSVNTERIASASSPGGLPPY